MYEFDEVQRQYNVLVFGLEKKGLLAPPEPLRLRNFSIFFEKYGTARRFNEFDGVLVFQGVFERFELKNSYMESYLTHTYDADELDKRKKEAALLLGQGGFLCFLLTDPFIDHEKGRDYKGTDLAKYHLNYPHLYRENFQKRIAHVTHKVDEFKRFLEIYGAASSYFKYHNDSIDLRVVAEVQSASVGLVIDRLEYFIPSLVPDNTPEALKEYFELLVDALISCHNKLHQQLPDWITSFKFSEEAGLMGERSMLEDKIAGINSKLQEFDQYKAVLCHSGPELVADVCRIFEVGLGIIVDPVDDFREDIKLLDQDGNVICVCEVKGINRGIKRENINQTDSHRERSGFDNKFPALLIANTNIKSARSIQEKEQEIAAEQVVHAVRMNILMMRTIDLLSLLKLVLAGKKSREDAVDLLVSNVGWLHVKGDELHVLSGD
ncbi:MAG: hypothetical protein PHD43_11765 [Methylococcales bacterium]|nr:hypothetical protein [Methylococcales bacterium]